MRFLAIMWLVLTIGGTLFAATFTVPIAEAKGVDMNAIKEYQVYDESSGTFYDMTYGQYYGGLSGSFLLAYIAGLIIGAIGNLLFYHGQPQTVFKVWFYIGGEEVGDYETEGGGLMYAGGFMIMLSWMAKLYGLFAIIIIISTGSFDITG